MQDAVIVAATRTAVGRAPNGALKTVRPDEMAAAVIAEALRRAPGVEPSDIEDVILGCAMPEAEQGLNVARIASLRAGVPVTASAVTVNRFCSSGLQAIAYAGERIPTRIHFDNEASETRTLLEIETEDRIGLLYAISQKLSELDLDISAARISTEKGAAIDSFYVREEDESKVLAPERHHSIERRLRHAIHALDNH